MVQKKGIILLMFKSFTGMDIYIERNRDNILQKKNGTSSGKSRRAQADKAVLSAEEGL